MTRRIEPEVDAAALARVKQPIANASGLPNACYLEPALFTRDRDELLGMGWAALLYSSQSLGGHVASHQRTPTGNRLHRLSSALVALALAALLGAPSAVAE